MSAAPARYCLTPLGQRLAAENLPLVYYLHRRFPPRRPIQGDERISAGAAALIAAVASYDDRSGVKFATYAARAIRCEWLRSEQEESLVRVPHYLWDREERRRIAGTSEGRSRIAAADRARRSVVSIDLWTDPAGDPIGWNLPDPREGESAAAEDAEQRDRDRERLREAMGRLPEAYRLVLEARAAGRTLAQAGRAVARSRQGAANIEAKAIAALRAALSREDRCRSAR